MEKKEREETVQGEKISDHFAGETKQRMESEIREGGGWKATEFE